MCPITLKLIKTYENAYTVCTLTLLAEPSIRCESGSDMMKSKLFVSDNTEIDGNI